MVWLRHQNGSWPGSGVGRRIGRWTRRGEISIYRERHQKLAGDANGSTKSRKDAFRRDVRDCARSKVLNERDYLTHRHQVVRVHPVKCSHSLYTDEDVIEQGFVFNKRLRTNEGVGIAVKDL